VIPLRVLLADGDQDETVADERAGRSSGNLPGLGQDFAQQVRSGVADRVTQVVLDDSARHREPSAFADDVAGSEPKVNSGHKDAQG